MGKRGPAPRPTALKILHGERESRINLNEPKPRNVLPEPPLDMTPDALEVWNYTIRELAPMRIATAADQHLLAAYCEAVAMHRRATRLLAKQELLVEGQRGNLVRNPAVQMQRDAAAQILQLGAQFGLNPRARSEFNQQDDGGEDERESLLS